MRLFVAINFNDATRGSLVSLRDELRSRAVSGSFTLVENLHLTLAFLGECTARQADAAKAAMDGVSFAPFDLLIERVGRFGGRAQSAGATWWAGVRVSEPLSALHRDLSDGLLAAGFTLDKRKFSPHVTFGRKVVTDAAPWRFEPFGEVVQGIDLMLSERVDGRLVYTSLHCRR